jgi:hypothetical protein
MSQETSGKLYSKCKKQTTRTKQNILTMIATHSKTILQKRRGSKKFPR